jgi:UDPglucose 6-dehydrogenase
MGCGVDWRRSFVTTDANPFYDAFVAWQMRTLKAQGKIVKDKRLAVWGLAFKPNTDDVRSSVAINLVERMVAEGANVVAYDPKAMDKAKELPFADKIEFATSAMEAAKGAEALIIATEWPEFAAIDLNELREHMRTPMIFDGRNLLDPVAAKSFGFQYTGIGRGVTPERIE